MATKRSRIVIHRHWEGPRSNLQCFRRVGSQYDPPWMKQPGLPWLKQPGWRKVLGQVQDVVEQVALKVSGENLDAVLVRLATESR